MRETWEPEIDSQNHRFQITDPESGVNWITNVNFEQRVADDEPESKKKGCEIAQIRWLRAFC